MTAKRIASGLALAGGSLVAAVTLLGFTGLEPLKLNATASLPKGLYVRTFETPRVGTIVWFPLPVPLQVYVAGVPGAAQWFAQPGNGLLKPVVGGAGAIPSAAVPIARSPSTGGRLGRRPPPALAAGRCPPGRAAGSFRRASSRCSLRCCPTASTAACTAPWRP